MYLMWFDDDKRHTVADKITQGSQAYFDRFGVYPNVVLINPNEAIGSTPTLQIKSTGYIRKNNYWFGFE